MLVWFLKIFATVAVMLRGIYLFIFVTVLPPPVSQSSFTGNLVFLANNPLYYCNDGSTGAYYWRPATSGANLNGRYLIFLQGGAWCWDQPSCQSRWASSPSLMSSNYWGSSMSRTDGVFASNDWSNANIAYIPYCSSDGWIGNRSKSSSTYNWYFNGKNIVQGVIDDLLNKGGLKNATEIFFTGCSAGGRGVFNLLDWATEYMRARINNGNAIRIKGLFDSAWWLEDFPPYPGQNPTTLVQQAQGIYSLANNQPQQDCYNLFGENYKWQCAFGVNVWPLVKTDHSYNLFLTDQWQLDTISNNAISSNPTASQLPYIIQFLNTTRFTLFPGRNMNHNIFAPSCFSHCSTESSNWFNIKISGINLDNAISGWFFRDQNFQLIDTCSTFKCGVGCP